MSLTCRFSILALASLFVAPVIVFAQTQTIPNPVTAEQLAAICTEAKSKAAARGYPDTASATSGFGPTITDTCVAAVLNPAVLPPNPRNPINYMCVGKRARIGVNSAGLITTSYIPDRTVPAGKCEATACTNYNESTATCLAASSPTPISTYYQSFLAHIESIFGVHQGLEDFFPVHLGIRG
jgi:hypothetical protein